MNNQLIPINYEGESPTVSGRELHAALEVTTDYPHWFARMCEYGFDGNQDYVLVRQICPTNNPKNPTTERADHLLTIPMAKEIAMIQRTDKGKEVRKYFISVEDAWNTPEQIMARALKLADRNIQSLKSSNDILKLQIETEKPKVIFADAVSASNSTILIGELAKILKGNGISIGQNRLFEILRQEGYLIKRKGTDWNSPTQYAMELGLFQIKETAVTHSDGHVTVTKTTKITGKGQQYFVNLFLNRKILYWEQQ